MATQRFVWLEVDRMNFGLVAWVCVGQPERAAAAELVNQKHGLLVEAVGLFGWSATFVGVERGGESSR